MELLQLRYFLVAAKYEHMTKAAEVLRIAQPALSQSIRRLEDELGVPLFAREKRAVRLNEAGKFLEKKLSPLLAALDEIPTAVREQAGHAGHTIHLNLLAATKLVTDCIISYKKQHPEIRFRLLQNPDMEQAELCVSTSFPGETVREDSLLLMKESFYMAVPAASPHACLKFVNLSDMEDEDFISLSNNRPIRQICDRYCLEAGFSPRTICETDNPESVRNLIAAGLGVGFWPKYSWGALSSPEIVFLPIRHPFCQRDIILTTHPREENEAAVLEFRRFLCLYAAQIENRPPE